MKNSIEHQAHSKENLDVLWYRNNEVEITLSDADNTNVDTVSHNERSLSRDGKFSKAKARLINDIALNLGIIEEPLPFPLLNKNPPEKVVWKKLSLAQDAENPLPRGDYVVLSKDGVLTEGLEEHAERVGYTLDDFESLLAKVEDADFRAHLQEGYCAYIFVKGDVIKWITVPEYHLTEKWAKETEDFDSKINAYVKLRVDIRKAQEFDLALAQYCKFQKLPFEWSIGIKQVLAGLGRGSGSVGERGNTVTHVVVESDFKERYLKRDKYDFFCSGKLSKANQGKSDYMHDIVVDGVMVKRIPQVASCKTCNKRIDKLLETILKEQQDD